MISYLESCLVGNYTGRAALPLILGETSSASSQGKLTFQIYYTIQIQYVNPPSSAFQFPEKFSLTGTWLFLMITPLGEPKGELFLFTKRGTFRLYVKVLDKIFEYGT